VTTDMYTGWPEYDLREREDWVRGVPAKGAPEYLHPIEDIRKWQAQFADQVRLPEYGPDGKETVQSLAWRAADAVKAARLAAGFRLHERGELESYASLRRRMGWSSANPEDIRRTASQAIERFHEQLPRAMASMGVGARCIEALADLVETDPVKWVRAWLDTGRRWALILTGAGGSGKSIALAEACRHFARETVRYGDGFEELQWRTRKACYTLASDMLAGPIFGEEGERRFQKFSRVDLLCLDDLGADVPSEQSKDFLWRILDGRYRNKRRTLIATNLSSMELILKLGERFGRRLRTDTEDGASIRTLKEPFRRGPSGPGSLPPAGSPPP